MLIAETLRSSTFKVALIWIAGFGALVIALFAFVYSSTASYVLNRSDRAIDADRAALIAAYEHGGRNELITTIGSLAADRRLQDRVYLLAAPSFGTIAGNLKSWPAALSGGSGRGDFSATDANPEAADQSLLRAAYETLPDGSHLLVGRNVSDFAQFARKIYFALASVVVLIFVLAVVAGITVTRRTVGRIESINATSRAIMQSGLQSGLGERVPLCGSRDEWDQLAENLNSMLDRIEVLMGEVKQATDNVAHDLRTPLTRMRGRLESASARMRDSGADQALITDTMADLDDVLRMFSSLTRISQIETTTRTSGFGSVDLVEVSEAVVDLYDAAAEDKDVDLKVVGDRPMVITGDRDLLFDAVANLVDNAIKHGREAGQVTVELSRSDADAVISVADNGPGIPIDEHQHVFRRFYRLERSRCTPGNGLGLSLVAAVARLHDARIRLFDNAPGLKIELRLPSA
ncbi:MAG: HAMP domain-containing sensor histidine kinase [Xanthobacteraceae bacterium]